MNDVDLKAIAVYLKDVPGAAPPSVVAADRDVLAAGGAIYQDLCSSCHAADGKGVPNMFPNLAETATVSASDPTTVLHVILQAHRALRPTKNQQVPRCLPLAGSSMTDRSRPSRATSAIASVERQQPSARSKCSRCDRSWAARHN